MKKYSIPLFILTLLLSACTSNQANLALNNNNQKEIQKEKIDVEKKSYDPISIDALIAKNFVGSDFTVGRVLADNEAYTRYYITYKSGELKISGIMNVPKGTGPWPLLILNHGYIDPVIYTNGRGLKREQDYLVRRGYVVVHPDYRNHADSDKDDEVEQQFRLGYTEDVINVIDAIKKADLSYINTDKIGMLGHSMGGGVTLNTLVTRPDLVDAAVLFAPVSADYSLNYDKWTKQRVEMAKEIEQAHGTPDSNPDFWKGVSAVNYFDRLKTPILNHHGTIDESVPLWWSNDLEKWLNQAGVVNTYYTYDNELHEFGSAWPLVMQRTVDFFDQYLKES